MPCQPPLLVSVAWQSMSLRPLFHLQVMFEAPQVAIGRPQGRLDGWCQESSLAQLSHGAQRVALLERRLASTIQELGELDKKFDFPNTSHTEFHIRAQLALSARRYQSASYHGADTPSASR